MYRCKKGKGLNKGLHGLKLVICFVFLLYILSYSSIVWDTNTNATRDYVQTKQSQNGSRNVQTTTYASDTTTSTLASTTDSSNSQNDRILNEDDRKTNEVDRTLSKEDHINEENRLLKLKDRQRRGDRHIFNKENNKLNEEADIRIKEDGHILSNKEHITDREHRNDDNKDDEVNEDLIINEDDRNISEGDDTENEDDRNISEGDDTENEDDRNISEGDDTENEDDRNISEGDDTVNEDYRNVSEDKRMINEKFFGDNRKVIGCKELFQKHISGAHRVRKIVTEELPSWTIRKYKERAENCSSFIAERGYITHHLTTEEQLFPIAFSILMYKNVEQVERLLRAIYRPQNIYCIHVDSKTNNDIHKALSSISDCFENVFVLQKRINVIWGKMSVLTPEILCMNELWKRHKTWKYFINLTGQEFPLKTNYELVKILQAYNGANDVEATVKQFTERCRGKSRIRPPHGIRVTKGAVHVAVTREYVDYVLHDSRARNILKWMSYSCDIPDEAFFTTLNHNPHLRVPGAYKGYPETTPISNKKKPFLARYKNRLNSQLHRWPCHGKWVRGMCIFNFQDLYQLSTRKELFANKFHLYDNPLPYACMEELIYNRTRDEFQGRTTFDASWYSTLGFVKNHVK